jgi:flagellar biosynthesis protein FlhA
VPGMPHFMILSASGIAGFIAWKLNKAKGVAAAVETANAELANAPAPLSPNSIDWNDVSDGAALGLELGYGLVGMVDERKGAPLMARITGIRRQLSRELGFVVPLVRVRDNLSLAPNAYRITVAGVIMGEDEAFPDQLLALDSGDLEGTVSGRECRDPSFGLEAVWITPDKRGEAIVAGYTVVDPATVVATHLNQIIAGAAADLFGMDEAQRLLEALKEAAPQLVAGLTPTPLNLAQIAAACRALLAEGVPLKDFRRIAEAMVDAATISNDANALVENIRAKIGALIVQTLVPVKMPLPVVTLDAGLESLLAQAVRSSPGAAHPFEPALANKIVTAISEASAPLVNNATRFAIVTSPIARRALARLLKPHLPETPVMSFLEIPDGKAVEVAAVVGGGPTHNGSAGALSARPMETAE